MLFIFSHRRPSNSWVNTTFDKNGRCTCSIKNQSIYFSFLFKHQEAIKWKRLEMRELWSSSIFNGNYEIKEISEQWIIFFSCLRFKLIYWLSFMTNLINEFTLFIKIRLIFLWKTLWNYFHIKIIFFWKRNSGNFKCSAAVKWLQLNQWRE